MTLYAYKCRECGCEVDLPKSDQAGRSCYRVYECPGKLKRVWSAGFVWPASERGH